MFYFFCVITLAMWVFHERSCAIVTLRNPAVSDDSNSSFFSMYGNISGFVFLEILSTLHFEGLKLMPHVVSHCSNAWNSISLFIVLFYYQSI